MPRFFCFLSLCSCGFAADLLFSFDSMAVGVALSILEICGQKRLFIKKKGLTRGMLCDIMGTRDFGGG